MVLQDKTKLIQQYILDNGGLLPKYGIDGGYGDEMADALINLLDIQPPEIEWRALHNETLFWNHIRSSLFGGRMTASQVDGIKTKLEVMSAQGWSIPYCAYAMATSYWETSKAMQPVEEGYYLGAERAKRHQKTLRYYPWFGRGDVQLTWERNYFKADKELGLNGALVADPSLALDTEISAKVLVFGMERGWFTNKKLGDYLSGERATRNSFVVCRYIINGTDKQYEIADIAMKWQYAFEQGEWR